MKVRVYYNLTKDCWSVQTHRKGKGWRVKAHVNTLCLLDVKTIIHKSGQERVRKENQKNVHAFLEGNLLSAASGFPLPIARKEQMQLVSYNPWVNDTFVWTEYGNEFKHSPVCLLTDKLWAL